jgi:hypothetical protein
MGAKPMPAIAAKYRSMRIRFRLRTLLLAAGVLALPLRWCGWHHERDRQFQNRIAAIEQLGGQVLFDSPNSPPPLDDKAWRTLGGDDQRGHPAYVIFSGDKRLRDDNLARLDLTSFPALAGLYLDGCNIGDQGLADFGALRDLKELSLPRTGISNRSLKVLGRLKQLEVLDLNGTDVTDAGLRELKSLKRLGVLSVRDTKVNRAALAELRAALPELLINHNAKH